MGVKNYDIKVSDIKIQRKYILDLIEPLVDT